MPAATVQLERAIAALTEDDFETISAWLAFETHGNASLAEFIERRLRELDTGTVDWSKEPLRRISAREYDTILRFFLRGRGMPWSERNRDWCRAVLAAMQEAHKPPPAPSSAHRRRAGRPSDDRFATPAEITDYIVAAYREQNLGRPGGRLPASAPLAKEADALIRQAIRLSGPDGITGVELRRLIPFGTKRLALGLEHLELAGQISQSKEIRPNSRGVPHRQLVWHAGSAPPNDAPPSRPETRRRRISSTAPSGA